MFIATHATMPTVSTTRFNFTSPAYLLINIKWKLLQDFSRIPLRFPFECATNIIINQSWNWTYLAPSKQDKGTQHSKKKNENKHIYIWNQCAHTQNTLCVGCRSANTKLKEYMLPIIHDIRIPKWLPEEIFIEKNIDYKCLCATIKKY